IRRDLQDQLVNPLAGWMGQRDLFHFDLEYRPAPGLRHFLTGTPPVLSLALVEPGVDLLLEAGLDALRAKSVQQTEDLIELWEALLKPLGFALNSPREPGVRGLHISLAHPEGLRIDLALINDQSVLPDFRAPDNIRLGIAPIYTSYRDIHTAMTRLQRIVAERLYERYSNEAPVVT